MNLVYSARNGNFANTKIGQTDGTVAGTNALVTMDQNFTDAQVNGFLNNSDQCVEVCNRGGPPGTTGVGTNWALPATLPSVNLTLASASRQAGLDAHIVNPHGAVTFGGQLYLLDSDQHAIYAIVINGTTFTVYGNSSVYNHSITDAEVTLGSAIEVIGDRLYALFYGYTPDGADLDHKPSELVRLMQGASGPGLVVDTSGGQGETGIRQLGLNAISMTQARDARNPQNIKDYLLIACVGGMQKGGEGNGANSVLTIVNATDYVVLGTNPLNGTATAPNGSVALDLHSVSATLPSEVDAVAPIAKGDCYVYVSAATYSDEDYYFTDYMLCETKLSTLLGYASAEEPHNLDDLRALGHGTETFGYFWATAFAPTSATGLPGKLVYGHGGDTGDVLDVYEVTQSGAPAVPTPITADIFYGQNQYGLLNSMTLVPYAIGGEEQTLRVKVMRSFTPPPVASGQVSMANFLVARKKKLEK